MVMEMPLDLVAEVRCRFGRDCASSKANFKMRSTPIRVITVCWVTNSRGVSGNMRPPTDEYSPSVFSRTDRKSTRLNSSHQIISYAVFCLKKKKNKTKER